MAEEAACWYVRSRGRVRGPFTWLQLEQMRNRQQLAQFDELSQDKRTWTAAGRVPALFPQAPGIASVGGSDSEMKASAPVQSADNWHCHTPTGTVGPVAITHIVALLHQGVLNANSPVWRPGLPAWVALRDVPDLSCHIHSSQLTGIHSRPGGPSLGSSSSTTPPNRSTRARQFLTTAAALLVFAAATALVALVVSNSKKTQQTPAVGEEERQKAVAAPTRTGELKLHGAEPKSEETREKHRPDSSSTP
jgi:hypothetical protein